MIGKLIASIVVALAFGAGVAYAATQLASSGGTRVCVNQINGLMRASSSCRDGEYAMTIGGGSDVVVTQNGTFTVDVGQSAAKTLPLTGITVTGLCEFVEALPYELYDHVDAHVRLDAANGATMDMPFARLIGGQSWTSPAIGGAYEPGWTGGGITTTVATSNQATVTITATGTATWSPQKCVILWQATEAPN